MKRPHVGLAVFIVRPDSSFLMGKRRNAHGDGTWTIPGGWLEWGETWEKGAIREILEETGLKIKPTIIHMATTNDFFEKEDEHSHTIWLRTKYMGG